MSDPTIDAARDVLAESLDKIRRGIAGLTVDQLNAKPAGGETNSVAVIATHALASTRSYMSIAVGAPPPPRDRPAEFRTVAADGFGGWVEDMIGQCLGLLDGVTFDPSIKGVRTWTQDPRGRSGHGLLGAPVRDLPPGRARGPPPHDARAAPPRRLNPPALEGIRP